MDNAILRHVDGDPMPYQWHAAESWIDPVTSEQTSYIAGFKTKAAAQTYGGWHGWVEEQD